MPSNKLNANKITFFNILSTVLLQGITFFTSPLFSRMLGPENFGIVSVYITWVSIAAIIFGLQTGSTIGIAHNQYSGTNLKQYLSSILSLSLISYTVFSSLTVIAIKPVSKLLGMTEAMYLLLLIHGLGQFCVNFINSEFTYSFRADRNFAVSMLNTGGSVALSVIFIMLLPPQINFWGRILGMAIVYAVLGIAVCIYVFKEGRTCYNKEYWGFCIPLALPIIFHSLSNTILGQCDRVMLQNIVNNTAVGIYSLTATFSSVISVIWNALNNSWVPFYYEYTRSNQIETMKLHAANYAELYTVLAMGFILLAPEVFRVFASSEYWSGNSLIVILSCGFYMVFLYSFPVNFEFYNKKTSVIAAGTLLAALINIVLNIIMIKNMGAVGAALATAISHGLQFSFHHICAKYIIQQHEEYPFTLKFFLPYITAFGCVVILCLVVQSQFVILRWGLGITIGLYEIRKIASRKAIF